MPVPATVIADGTHAVLVSAVAIAYKVTAGTILVPVYCLMVIPQGVASSQGAQLHFPDAAARDAFYTALVDAMS